MSAARTTDTASNDPLSNSVVTPRPWLAVRTLCWREIIRFLRQRNRVIGAVGQPILFWLLFGAGLQRSFSLSAAGSTGQSFLEYYFPGSLMLVLMFTAIFATISIIEDRREGFLQSVLVAPIPRWSMVLGKVMGGTLIALLQGLIFLALAPTLKITFDLPSLIQIVALLFLTALALTSLGFVIAWRMESTQGFHAIMNLALMPMWMLSGAFWPIPAVTAGSSVGECIMSWSMRLNPLTYCLAAVRHLFHAPALSESFYQPSLLVCWLVTPAFAMITFLAAWKIAEQRTTGDLL